MVVSSGSPEPYNDSKTEQQQQQYSPPQQQQQLEDHHCVGRVRNYTPPMEEEECVEIKEEPMKEDDYGEELYNEG